MSKEIYSLEIIAEVSYQNRCYVLDNNHEIYEPMGLPGMINPYKNNTTEFFRKINDDLSRIILESSIIYYKDGTVSNPKDTTGRVIKLERAALGS